LGAARVCFQQIFPLCDGYGLAEEAGPCSEGSRQITPFFLLPSMQYFHNLSMASRWNGDRMVMGAGPSRCFFQWGRRPG